jgi:hypothetical protein
MAGSYDAGWRHSHARGGQNAPIVSEVAKQLAEQNLEKEGSESVGAIIDRVTSEAIEERKKVAREFARQAKLTKAKKRGRRPKPKRTEADEGEGQGLGGAPVENAPAADAVVAEDVEEHVGDADGKTQRKRGKRKRGKRKRGRGGQGAKSGPDRQQAAPVVNPGHPSGASREIGIPKPDNRPNLSLPCEQRKDDVDQRYSAINRTRPTRWDKPPAQAPRRSPPRRDTRRSPERTMDNFRRSQRTPSPVDRRLQASGLCRWRS